MNELVHYDERLYCWLWLVLLSRALRDAAKIGDEKKAGGRGRVEGRSGVQSERGEPCAREEEAGNGGLDRIRDASGSRGALLGKCILVIAAASGSGVGDRDVLAVRQSRSIRQAVRVDSGGG